MGNIYTDIDTWNVRVVQIVRFAFWAQFTIFWLAAVKRLGYRGFYSIFYVYIPTAYTVNEQIKPKSHVGFWVAAWDLAVPV
jgi:hypothetical protein